MQSFFNAVGLGSRTSSKPPGKKASHSGGSAVDELLPDLAKIAAATESGILTLEDEAKTLEHLSPSEALALLQGWSQSLRQRPRPDESFASFRAKFLRSNALERSIDGLRKSGAVRTVLVDKPLFTQSGGSTSSTAQAGDLPASVAGELRSLLQMCLQKSAAPLAEPALRVAICETKEECAMAMTALRVFKEDWAEVVHNQALKGLERRLDSLSYQLQKSGVARKEHLNGESDAAGMRRASRDRVIVLCLLCTALEESHTRAKTRIAEVASALTAAGLYSLVVEPTNSARQARRDKRTSSFPEESTDKSLPSELPVVPRLPGTGGQPVVPRARADSGCAPSNGAASDSTTVVAGTGSASGSRDEATPTLADCEAAVPLLGSQTEQEFSDGLRLLGLPMGPLRFVPGVQLRLCGLDVQQRVSALVHYWVNDDKSKFFDALQRLRGDLNQSSGSQADLVAEKKELLEERTRVVRRLSELDERLSQIDAFLTQELSCVDDTDEILAEGFRPPLRGVNLEPFLDRPATVQTPTQASTMTASKRSSPSDTHGRSVTTSPAGPRAALQLLHDNAKTAAELDDVHGQFTAAIAVAAEAFATETRRAVERVATQLQQRRGQLFASLIAHLESERERLFARALADDRKGISATAEGSAVARERLDKAVNTAKDLCKRAEAALGADDAREQETACRAPLPPGLRPGAMCQARWLDGCFYDASVQTIMGDRSVVVNWLRQRPASLGPPLKTVGDAGGDDTLCRIIPVADLRLLDDEPGQGAEPSCSASLADDDGEIVRSFFRSRGQEDLVCADCHPSWSSEANNKESSIDPTSEWDADACASAAGGATRGGGRVVEWASISFGTYLCAVCAAEHSKLGARVSLLRRLDDAAGWKLRELEYIRNGGNGPYFEALRVFPSVVEMELVERLTCRFAEYYRRHLDACCTGAQLPAPPSAEVATQPAGGEFIGAGEGATAVRETLQKFEAGAGLVALPSAWRGLGGPVSLVSTRSTDRSIGTLTSNGLRTRSQSITSPYAL